MAISRELLNVFVGTTSKRESPAITPAPYDNRAFFSQHEDIFKHYGINHNTIDPKKVTIIETVDGPFCVFGPQRAICPPERYYLTLHSASLIGNKP